MCLPVVLDCGTNNEAFLADPFYMGLRQKREQGERFEQLVEEFMDAAKAKYGPQVLLQFEDFGNTTAFHLLRKFEKTHCTFNDDIQVCRDHLIVSFIVFLSWSAAHHHFLPC